ncbi:hypothetical protein FGK63_20385 [Ruegeria sediminis]|uniref:Uncharacterized protein n=1 Tax=Ruegeria sediminis TaxID=2583820 RepID=A0ABY2WS47_9RHOB|nr:hypothetical protein [Ruegeria sediminis]TMV02588.1 hypothetical protein FGK63_20385 [Ruegeria sediminis]
MMTDHSAIDYDNIRESVARNLGRKNLGWIEIVTRCFESIKEHCDQKNREYPRVFQIKQKFGELRIYLHEPEHDGPDYISLHINEACREANRSCEVCGNNCSQQWLGAWVRNLCCFCAHSEARRQQRDLSNYPLNANLDCSRKCTNCGYIGQLAHSPGRGDQQCVACVIESL